MQLKSSYLFHQCALLWLMAHAFFAPPVSSQDAVQIPAGVKTQDDVLPLLTEANSLTAKGEYKKAIGIFKAVLQVPAAPGARPPGMIQAPRDYRGEVRWGLAEILRAQCQWQQALDLYELNRATYPRDDGCVPTGFAFQKMAITEGICLENLGRHNEAAKLYWQAALHLSPDSIPFAARRLIDLYHRTGQIKLLTGALQREKTAFLARYVDPTEGRPLPEEEMKKRLPEILARTAFPDLKVIHDYRRAAHSKNWGILTTILRYKLPQDSEGPMIKRLEWQKREAIAALSAKQSEAVPFLEREMKRNSAPLQEALLACRNLANHQDSFLTPLVFPVIPAEVKLPNDLPAVFSQPLTS